MCPSYSEPQTLTSSSERLTELNLSDNEINSIRSIDALTSLESLNLDDNELSEFPEPSSRRVSKVKHLSLSRNSLRKLDVSSFRALRTLTADSNNLPSLHGTAKLRHLRTISARNQHPESGVFDSATFLANPDISELYLSSNTIPTLAFPENAATPFLNLQRLELSSCGLHTLPERFGQLAPNVRALNLNFNALKDLRPLLNAKKLERLDLAGNRLSRLRRNVLVLGKITTLRRVDLRNNAFNVGFYPPPMPDRRVSRTGLSDEHDGSESSSTFSFLMERGDEGVEGGQLNLLPAADEDRDRTYVCRLDPDTKMRRRVYEMLAVSSCKGLRALDGLAVRREDVMRKDEVFERLVMLGVVKKKGKKGGRMSEGGLVMEGEDDDGGRGGRRGSGRKMKNGVEVEVREVSLA